MAAHLASASEAQLPAEVLARVFRTTPPGHQNGDLALKRLLADYAKYKYVNVLRYLARQRANGSQDDADDMFQDAIAEIVETLGGERGVFAEESWMTFCRQRFGDAWRRRFGRDGARVGPDLEPLDEKIQGDALHTVPPWHGRVDPDKMEWLEGFVRRQLASNRDEALRVVCMDQWFDDPPSPISGKSKDGRPPLTETLNLSRDQINRRLRTGKALIWGALGRQKECELDIDWMRPHS
jgi:DNA-directed RNA polymerase specialized sigma24 family protein